MVGRDDCVLWIKPDVRIVGTAVIAALGFHVVMIMARALSLWPTRPALPPPASCPIWPGATGYWPSPTEKDLEMMCR